MRRHFWNFVVAAMLVFCATRVFGAPTLISDPVSERFVTHCAWYLGNEPRVLVPVAYNSAGLPYCTLDLNRVPAGIYSVRAAMVVASPGGSDLEGAKSSHVAIQVVCSAVQTVFTPGRTRRASRPC